MSTLVDINIMIYYAYFVGVSVGFIEKKRVREGVFRTL